MILSLKNNLKLKKMYLNLFSPQLLKNIKLLDIKI